MRSVAGLVLMVLMFACIRFKPSKMLLVCNMDGENTPWVCKLARSFKLEVYAAYVENQVL